MTRSTGAAGSLRAIPAPETFTEGVGRVLGEFATEAEKIELVPDELTAHHETGHLVVGYANGSTVGGLITCCGHRIEGKGLVWGFTEFAEHRSTDAHAMTLFAGPLAELRFKASRTPARDLQFDANCVPAWGDRLDYGRLLAPWDAQTEEEFGQALRLLDEAGRREQFATLLSTTQKTLNCANVWGAIERLAAALFHARTLRGDEAVGIIAPLVPLPDDRRNSPDLPGTVRRLAHGFAGERLPCPPLTWLMRFSSSARIASTSSKLSGSDRYISRIDW